MVRSGEREHGPARSLSLSFSSALGEVVLLAAVSALAATAAAPLARVRRRVLQNLRGGTRGSVTQNERNASELRSNPRGRQRNK
jgi:hypothetical protein